MTVGLVHNPSIPCLGVVACLALLVYDYLITFTQEVAYIWGKRWTPGKVLFCMVRYLGFVDIPMLLYAMLTNAASETGHCAFPWLWYTWSAGLGFLTADTVIALRTWAVWRRSRACGAVLGAAFLLTLIVTVYFKVVFSRTIAGGSQALAFPSCRFMEPIVGSHDIVAVYIIFAIYEGLIFGATALQGFVYIRRTRTTLTTVLFRDAFLASACLLVCAITSAVLVSVDGVDEAFLLFSNMHRVFSSILPARIILNIRQTAVVDEWDMTTVPARAQP